jgi:thioredoxin-like negative regulator of GroEL
MIELLLVADRLLEAGDLDHADRIFRQVAEADPRNAIAVVGLARVATLRGDDAAATNFARHELEVVPDDEAARRLLLVDRVPTLQAEPSPPPMRRRSLLERFKALMGIRAKGDP